MNFNPMNMIVNRIKQRMGNNNPMMNNVIQMVQNRIILTMQILENGRWMV